MTPTMLLIIFVGGGVGATCRYGVGRAMASRYQGTFPLSTFLVNVTGCFAIGIVATALSRIHSDMTLPTALLTTGFLGGYTTYSTYALETMLLYEDGSRRLAIMTLFAPVVIGLLAVTLGAAVASVV